MANEYLVNSADMTAVADAIRSKGGTSDALTFPGGFVDAVGAIQAGSGSGDDVATAIIMNTLEEITNSEVTSLRSNIFRNATSLKSVDFPNVVSVNGEAFSGASNLESVKLPNAKKIEGAAFRGVNNITTLEAPNLETVGVSVFQDFKKIVRFEFLKMKTINNFFVGSAAKSVRLPNLTYVSGGSNFSGCSALEFIDFGHVDGLRDNTFKNCTSLTRIVLRNVNIVNLRYTNSFDGCGTTINVYVPSALVSEYPNATNWSAVTGATLNFVALEGSEYE